MREQATAVEFLLKVSGINVNPTNVDDATPLDVGYDAAVFALLKRAGGISGQERQLLQDKTKADARLNNILQNPHTAPPSVGTADTIATLKSGALAETKATYDLFAASLDELAGYHNEWVDLILDIGALLTTLQGYNTILPNASGVDAVVPGAKGFGYVRPIGSGLQQVFITSDPVKSAVTTLHEYTHLALMRAFQNRSKPFARENESVDKAHVEALAKATDEDEKNVQSVTTMSQVVADEVKKIFAAFREYSTDLQPDEIISHVSEMIYQTLKANVGIAQLDLGVPKLMAYLRTKVEPELRKLRRELRSAARLRQPTPSAATNAPPATPTLTSGLTAAISPLDKDDALRRRAQLLVGKLESAIQAITTLEAAKAAPGTEAKPPKLPDPSDVQADLSDAARQHTQVTTLLSKKQPSGSVTTDQLLEIGNQLTALQQLQTTLAQRLNAAKP
jgi:hypothetical protein